MVIAQKFEFILIQDAIEPFLTSPGSMSLLFYYSTLVLNWCEDNRSDEVKVLRTEKQTAGCRYRYILLGSRGGFNRHECGING